MTPIQILDQAIAQLEAIIAENNTTITTLQQRRQTDRDTITALQASNVDADAALTKLRS